MNQMQPCPASVQQLLLVEPLSLPPPPAAAYLLPAACRHPHTLLPCLHPAGPQQLMVENYFNVSGTLPATEYWLGISRAGSTNPYKYISGQLISTVVRRAATARAQVPLACQTAEAVAQQAVVKHSSGMVHRFLSTHAQALSALGNQLCDATCRLGL
jgi:hypothetical protein